VNGGHPVQICELPDEPALGYGGAWSPDGEAIVFAAGSPSKLYLVSSASGGAHPLLSEKALSGAMRFAPDVLLGCFFNPHYVPLRAGQRMLAFSFGYLDPILILHDLDAGKTEMLGRGSAPFYTEPGYLIHTRPGSHDLWALPLDAPKMRGAGEAFRVAPGGMHASVSRDGTLVYLESAFERLAWCDRSGKTTSLFSDPAKGIFFPSVSPDGRHVAMETEENANLDVWVLDVERETRTRLTNDPATDILPTWSPDGSQVVYGSYRSGSIDIWQRRADGGTAEELLLGTAPVERVSDWSRDGQFILYSATGLNGSYDLHYLTRDANGKWESRVFLKTPADERVAKLSPDGRYAAYLSDESGRMELYVRSFPTG
jgi:Tol biopolymer transport system component